MTAAPQYALQVSITCNGFHDRSELAIEAQELHLQVKEQNDDPGTRSHNFDADGADGHGLCRPRNH
jgi:hypothetical protein